MNWIRRYIKGGVLPTSLPVNKLNLSERVILSPDFTDNMSLSLSNLTFIISRKRITRSFFRFRNHDLDYTKNYQSLLISNDLIISLPKASARRGGTAFPTCLN